MIRRFLYIILLSLIISANLTAETEAETETPDTSNASDFIDRSFNLTFNDLLSGREIRTIASEDNRAATLVVFWSINCGPCLREIPELNVLYTEWKPDGLEIIGIPQDERPEQVLSLCNRFGITWPQFMESGRPFKKPTTAAWQISHTPDFILLDSAGRVIEYGFTDPTAAVEGLFP
ncbi:MAG: TlpA family protein disulfide reductase [Spirochaetaceae bacterium]|nr:TlpA family protein disulfide reductase [Spirochaetaceae bacterium]